MTLSAQLRAAMLERDGQTAAYYAKAVGRGTIVVGPALRKLWLHGMVRREGERNQTKFWLIRLPTPKFTKAEIRASQRRREKRYKAKRTAKRREQAAILAALRADVPKRAPRPVLTPEESKARRAERQAKYQRARQEKQREAKRIAREAMLAAMPVHVTPTVTRHEPETIEQWMQRTGNKPDVLPPCQYIASLRVPARVPVRGAGSWA